MVNHQKKISSAKSAKSDNIEIDLVADIVYKDTVIDNNKIDNSSEQ